MRRVRTLFVLAGYGGDVERPRSQLKRRFSNHEYDFLAQTYPENFGKQQGYVKAVGERIIKYIFGDVATNFCRAQDLPCAAEFSSSSRGKNAQCKLSPQTACHRSRPNMLVFVVNPAIFDEVFRRFGRAALLMRFDSPNLADINAVTCFLEAKIDLIEDVRDFLANLRNNVLAPRLPKMNFQDWVNQPIARDAQADIGRFNEIMNAYHRELYDPAFQNPRRKELRGGYIFNERIRFQKDRLHKTAQIGEESRRDVFHLINTFHLYGFAVEPGFHFDVMSVGGARLNQTFRDIVSGKASLPDEDHVNISPCDRLL